MPLTSLLKKADNLLLESGVNTFMEKFSHPLNLQQAATAVERAFSPSPRLISLPPSDDSPSQTVAVTLSNIRRNDQSGNRHLLVEFQSSAVPPEQQQQPAAFSASASSAAASSTAPGSLNRGNSNLPNSATTTATSSNNLPPSPPLSVTRHYQHKVEFVADGSIKIFREAFCPSFTVQAEQWMIQEVVGLEQRAVVTSLPVFRDTRIQYCPPLLKHIPDCEKIWGSDLLESYFKAQTIALAKSYGLRDKDVNIRRSKATNRAILIKLGSSGGSIQIHSSGVIQVMNVKKENAFQIFLPYLLEAVHCSKNYKWNDEVMVQVLNEIEPRLRIRRKRNKPPTASAARAKKKSNHEGDNGDDSHEPRKRAAANKTKAATKKPTARASAAAAKKKKHNNASSNDEDGEDWYESGKSKTAVTKKVSARASASAAAAKKKRPSSSDSDDDDDGEDDDEWYEPRKRTAANNKGAASAAASKKRRTTGDDDDDYFPETRIRKSARSAIAAEVPLPPSSYSDDEGQSNLYRHNMNNILTINNISNSAGFITRPMVSATASAAPPPPTIDNSHLGLTFQPYAPALSPYLFPFTATSSIIAPVAVHPPQTFSFPQQAPSASSMQSFAFHSFPPSDPSLVSIPPPPLPGVPFQQPIRRSSRRPVTRRRQSSSSSTWREELSEASTNGGDSDVEPDGEENENCFQSELKTKKQRVRQPHLHNNNHNEATQARVTDFPGFPFTEMLPVEERVPISLFDERWI